MRVIMTGGGTGGHVNPAIAIANTIKRNDPDAEILFVGTARGIENKLTLAEGYPIKHVEIQGFKRSLSPKNIKAAYLAFVSPMRAKKIVKEFKPDIVIGTGGYVCWPVLVAASKMGIPTAVHESNAYPGVAVRKLQSYVDRIWLNFEESAKHLTAKEKIRHVGNPLRTSFEGMKREEARKQLGIDGKYDFYILSYGGSMGAEKVNDACLELMRDFGAKNEKVLHQHATGAIEWEAANEKFSEFGLGGKENLVLSEYIYDMPLRMAAADIVISRAGAMTVSELAMMKKTSIMIPSPNVTNNHQYKNAKVISDMGGTVLIEEKDLHDGRLMREVEALMNDTERRQSMGEAISHFADLDANKIIYEEIKKLIKKG
ncbi:MAG: undecaprenyldiphospho-muramoylpentapeptide beta-N-acetylglucosaminyltransferase [Ruminococcaceae bacterium]|nr:undecaprenyldiphospho-muramoylpentapeptide beta-N-acetylglucosaminyltransferase [Oscillospiraceae bacterium]